MSKTSFLLDFGLLRSHAAFRTLFIARLVSVLSLGLLAVAIPIQVQALTDSPLKVGLALSMAGIGMFVGLLTGGVLADRLERRRLILAARSICGLGFIGLAVNASLPEPSLTAIYLLALWDGFFGALGVTALLAVTPILVGRESMVQAGALNMLSVRVAAIVAPPLGTLLIAQSGVAWNYGLTAGGTLITLLVLLRLPPLPPPEQPRETPWQALGGGIAFLFENRLLGAVALVGALVTMANAVRVLYPSLGEDWGLDTGHLGWLYAAAPLGAAIGALTSGRLNQAPRPGRTLLMTAVATFLAVAVFALLPGFWLSALCLVLFGYLGALNSLVQYALIQRLTPDRLLGRINALWTAQNIGGEAIGAALFGGLASLMLPAQASCVFGLVSTGVAALCWALARGLRRAESLGA
ncbi:MAG: MFS transporter [Pseudomonas sp. PGPPP4]|uniref:enterobactin transporter EntS n=1 Tax=Pseudomonas sp. PGPPP4 TaxID=2015556 RepID=UPI000BDCA233|nr:enterobactin transporter EntS [Pseudomonas sp. PGPPP4]OYT79135.1 MAG: MFS transporter [Pseudomonas sp. PGPPP4]